MSQKRTRAESALDGASSAANSVSNTPKQPSKKPRRKVLIASSSEPLSHSAGSARRDLDFSGSVDPVQVDSYSVIGLS